MVVTRQIGLIDGAGRLRNAARMSGLSFLLLLLLLFNYHACVCATVLLQGQTGRHLHLLLFFLAYLSGKFFLVSSVLGLYILFEATLLPIFILIIG